MTPTTTSTTAPTHVSDPQLTWEGVRTVAGLELRQRIRTSRWIVVLSGWAVVIYGVALLSWLATAGMTEPDGGRTPAGMGTRSVVLYSVTVFFVLGLSLMVVPSLTSSSVNGDREHGVLATLQTTLLSAQEIILGKLLASWAVAGVFLVIGLPLLVFSVAVGGIDIGTLLMAVLCLAIVLAAVCAFGLMFSTLTARPVTSAVLTYLTVGFLTAGSLVFVAVLSPLMEQQVQRQVRVMQGYAPGDSGQQCVWVTATRTEVRTDRIWGLLAINPFVVVADAAPGRSASRQAFEPLGGISDAVRGFRAGPPERIDECYSDPNRDPSPGQESAAPVWPYGLVALALAGTGATAVAIRRVRTPIGRLPKGVRIA
ncbi:MAG: ABC transporter permease [Austwickia sp.]|jgi:ABC-2 type transport system permease protein|nr:ABC transporter permease [Austwickia sp.]MBK9100059.1 ABC transporter permease [Austwickia sp.]